MKPVDWRLREPERKDKKTRLPRCGPTLPGTELRKLGEVGVKGFVYKTYAARRGWKTIEQEVAVRQHW